MAQKTKDHGPQIKNDSQYERLRKQGLSKEKAARIANTPRSEAGRRRAKSPQYEEWTKQELYKKAQQVGIKRPSQKNKKELIHALRHH